MLQVYKNIFAFIASQLVGYSLGIYFGEYSLLIHGIAAGVICILFGASTPWIICSALIPLIFVLPQISSIYLLFILIILLLIFLPTVWTRIPFYPTFPETIRSLETFLEKKHFKNFIDIGSGFGHVGLSLSKKFPDSHFYGYELGVLPFVYSKIFSKKNTSFFMKNFWKISWNEFDVVYVFLSPEPMENAYKKFMTECKSRSVLISNSFVVPNVIPDQVIDGRQKLYVYEHTNKSDRNAYMDLPPESSKKDNHKRKEVKRNEKGS